jgi:hypothetical protein
MSTLTENSKTLTRFHLFGNHWLSIATDKGFQKGQIETYAVVGRVGNPEEVYQYWEHILFKDFRKRVFIEEVSRVTEKRKQEQHKAIVEKYAEQLIEQAKKHYGVNQ